MGIPDKGQDKDDIVHIYWADFSQYTNVHFDNLEDTIYKILERHA